MRARGIKGSEKSTWADSLQNSDIAGPRHLNAQIRPNYEKRKDREQGAAELQKLVAQHLAPGHPLRPKSEI